MKRTNAPCKQQENRALLIKKFGFYDISAELAHSWLEESNIKVLHYQQATNENAIRESDELSIGHSMNDSSRIEEPIPIENILKVKESRRISNQVLNLQNTLPNKLEKKNDAFSGMLGLSQPEINKLCIEPTILADFDDFTDRFFNKIQSKPILAAVEKNKLGKGNNYYLVSPKRISKSFLDFGDCNNEERLIDLNPSNLPANLKLYTDQDRFPLENYNDLPFETIFKKHENLIPEEIKNNQEEVLNKSEKEGIIEEQKIQILLQNEPKKEGNDDIPLEKKENLVNLQEISEAVFEEKFILRMGEITAESALDVQPKKKIKIGKPENGDKIAQCIQPYKIKLIIIPTEWPANINIEENEEEKGEIQPYNNVIFEGQSNASMSYCSREGNVSELSKSSIGSTKSKRRSRRTTKKNPKSKKKRNSKKDDDNSSRFSSCSKKKSEANTPRSAVVLKSKGTKSFNNEEASVVGSVISNSRRDEKNFVIEESKKQQKIVNEVSENKKNQNQDTIQKKPEQPWSGQEVLIDCNSYAAVWMTTNITEIRICQHGILGILANIRRMIRKFVLSEIWENFMIILTVINTVVLAMYRYPQPETEYNTLEQLNYAFTSIFTVELTLKLFGLGFAKYFSNNLHYLDLLIVLLSWMEIIFVNGSAFSSFNSFRVFRLLRTVRVLRVIRLLTGLHTMMTLMEVIADTIGSFGYIGLMLFLIMITYALFGMTLFEGKWTFADGLPRPNFESFNEAFISVFQLLTIENWPTLLYAGLRNQFQPLAALYFISFIMIGNYILLNLFLAIMLDSFVELNGSQDDNEEDVLNK